MLLGTGLQDATPHTRPLITAASARPVPRHIFSHLHLHTFCCPQICKLFNLTKGVLAQATPLHHTFSLTCLPSSLLSVVLLPRHSYLSVTQIRKLFNLTKHDDVRKYVNTYRRTFEVNGKKHSKAPKIQRLVTPETLQVRLHYLSNVTLVKCHICEGSCVLVTRLGGKGW